MSRTTAFIPRLESMRGIAALIVAASHIVQSPTGPDTGLLTHPGADASEGIRLISAAVVHMVDGLQAVIFFFVLSGFVLTRSLLALPRPSPAQATDFVIARLFRLYPAVIFAVAAFALARTLFGTTPVPWTVLENMALIDTSMNGVMWSLQLELMAIPLIYIMYLLLRRHTAITRAAAIAICLVLLVMSFDPSIHKMFGGHPSLQLYYAFSFGCFCAAASGRWASRLTTTQANIATAVAIVLFFTARPLLGPASPWRFVVNALSAWMLIYLATYGPRATLLNVLDHPAAHWLGKLSFSFYLFHFLTILPVWSHPEIVVGLVDSGVPRLLIVAVILVASTAATLVLAYIAYTLVEIPGIRLGRQVRALFAPRIRNAQTG